MKRLLLVVVATACASAGPAAQPGPKLNRFGRPVKEGIVVPGWVDKIPESGKGKMYAVGPA